MTAETIHIPNATPWDLITESIDDALLEAKNWADGTGAETQEQVDEIARLIDDLSSNAKALEAERVAEKKPLDDQIDAIQTRFNAYLAPLKNKVPGKVPLAIDALNAAKRPFLLKREQEIEDARVKAQEEAHAAAQAAADAARTAAPDDLEARQAADLKAQEAEQAASDAKAAEKVKAHAYGSGRAQGLRTRVIAEITDLDVAVRFYWGDNKEAFRDLVQKLADNDARGLRKIATGITFTNERY